MNVKKKARRVMSGLLTAVTVLSTVLSPAVAYASDDAGSVKKIPYYEEIKDQLDEDEVVTAKDYEIKVGDNFDVKSDYTGLTIQDDSKVKVTFQEAKDADGNDFSTDYANSYKAVYYVEPQTTDHPTYQINRKIVVKEADQQKDSQSESSSDQDAGSSDKTETEDSEADSSTEETDAADTESKTELTEKEFDAEIEATENQETVDPETGITLSEVMQEAVDQEVALAISDRIAIMDNNGNIRQIGTPYEIFEKPADLFIFKFMGIANFLGVREENGAYLVGSGMQQVPWEKPQGSGIKNWVAAFRPSDVIITRGGTGLKGIIKRANFLGATMDYMIEIDGEHLRTEIVTHEAISEKLMFNEGEECVVNFRALHWFDAAQLKEVEEL